LSTRRTGGLSRQVDDRIDENDPLRRNHANKVGIVLGDMAVMALAENDLVIGRRIDAADQARDVDRIRKCPHR